jgi:hypothetical protein
MKKYIADNCDRATALTANGCLGYACDGLYNLISTCFTSFSSVYTLSPELALFCACTDSSFQSYGSACSSCYASIGATEQLSLLTSILEGCTPPASLTSSSPGDATISIGKGQKSHAPHFTCGTQELVLLTLIIWLPLGVLLRG